MSRPERLFIGLLVVALLGAGWAYYRAQARRAATLARLTALETRLMASNQQRARVAHSIVSNLSETVHNTRNLSASVVVLRQAQKIEICTETLIDTLHQMRQSWQLASRSTGLRQLPNQLNQYLLFMKEFVPDAPLLNRAYARVEAIGWLGQFDTASEPKLVALALLTKLENQAWQLATEALEKQAQKVVFEGVFDRLGAFAAANSSTVAVGSIYQAQLALVMATSTSRMHFSANGRAAPIAPATGQALVQFRVPAARHDQPDTVRAEWRGRAQLPRLAGDTTLEIIVPYFIVKPR